MEENLKNLENCIRGKMTDKIYKKFCLELLNFHKINEIHMIV